MSEIVRRATEDWLDLRPAGPRWEGPIPVYDLGIRVFDPDRLPKVSAACSEVTAPA